MIIFTGAIVATLGFVLNNKSTIGTLRPFWELAFVFLFFGHVFYSTYVHDRLTRQRNVLSRVEYLLGFGSLKVGNLPLLFYKVEAPKDDNFRHGWGRGLWSHLLPFFVVDAILVGIAIAVLSATS